MRRNDDWLAIVGVTLLVILFFTGAILWTKFQWNECRKNPDNTFWFCVQHLD